MATLIVLAVLLPDAAAAYDAAATANARVRATTSVLRLWTLPVRASCMVAASSERINPRHGSVTITLSRQRCQDSDLTVQSVPSPASSPARDFVVRVRHPSHAPTDDGRRRLVGG